jgi:hypothetical protein
VSIGSKRLFKVMIPVVPEGEKAEVVRRSEGGGSITQDNQWFFSD